MCPCMALACKVRLASQKAHPHARMAAAYEPLKYEQLTDLTSYLERGDWGCATDATAGFHHFSLHPSMWEYVAFQAPDGSYFVYTGAAAALI